MGTACSADLFCRSAVRPPMTEKAADLKNRSALRLLIESLSH